jgi:hypothetical protein
MLMGFPVEASVVPVAPWANPARPVSVRVVPRSPVNDTKILYESLRVEVARHPGDFIVFATEAGAKQFFMKHRDDVELETNPRIIDRGVMGYWQDKTIVVLPWDSLENLP